MRLCGVGAYFFIVRSCRSSHQTARPRGDFQGDLRAALGFAVELCPLDALPDLEHGTCILGSSFVPAVRYVFASERNHILS